MANTVLPRVTKLLAILAASTFVVLGLLAISAKEITLGGRLGLTHHSGIGAEIVGFVLFFAAGFFARTVYGSSRYRRLIDVLLLGVWVVAASTYALITHGS